MLGHLRAAIDAGALPVTEAQADLVRAVHRAMQLRVLSLESGLVSLAGRLDAAGVATTVLKGSAYAPSSSRIRVPMPVTEKYREFGKLRTMVPLPIFRVDISLDRGACSDFLRVSFVNSGHNR